MERIQKIIRHVQERYPAEVDNPFQKIPEATVLRHKRNRKWFGLLMEVEGIKLGLNTNDNQWILTIKLPTEIIDMLVQKEGYYRAYHMNKQHWISLDIERVSWEDLLDYLEQSYNLTL